MLLLVSSVATGSLVLLLLVQVVICLVCKRRPQAMPHGVPQFAVRNHYEDPEDEVVQLYENFEQVECKKRQLEQASGLVDEDYDEREKNNTGRGCVQSQLHHRLDDMHSVFAHPYEDENQVV
ncbi:unnamed protein product [Pleuronectes platessa]|uniref:Uncharacterized protein n=1 Tax=Pleuronectes platessa TaxID=8262 RepID=A0A9N7VFZ4_PLEPL|nr:unnamed protein product [Pleuronectes platessa]